MSLPESLGSIYESIARVWRGRFIAAARRPPTGKRVLCGYVSTIDRSLPVTDALIQAMITESGVTEADIAAARRAAAQPASQAQTRANLTLELLWSLEHQGGRIGVADPALADWLNDLFGRFGSGDERLGGAPGAMVDTLTRLCGEQNAVIFTVFHSRKQASVYHRDVRFLTADAPAVLGTVPAQQYHQVRPDRPDDPDVRNYPLTYQHEDHLSWGPDPAGSLTVAHGPDRLICTGSYRHFDADGKVRRDKDAAAIERIFQFPGLTEDQRDACAAAVTEGYPYIVLTGLQGAGEPYRPAIERDLALLAGQATIHIELSAARNLPWLRTVIARYVSSVGVNDDELPEVCLELTGKTAATNGSYDSLWALHQDARAVAVALDLPRLYVHNHIADLVLRRMPVKEKALAEEILADLYAKWKIIEWLRGHTAAGAAGDVKLKREGLEALTTFMAQAAGLSDKALLQWLADTALLARQGHFGVVDDYAVAVMPVAWFHGGLAQQLITTGAGDRSSVVSFVQSCFTQPKPITLA